MGINIFHCPPLNVKACPHQEILFGNNVYTLFPVSLQTFFEKSFPNHLQTVLKQCFLSRTVVVRMSVSVEVATVASVFYLALLIWKGKRKKEMGKEIFGIVFLLALASAKRVSE